MVSINRRAMKIVRRILEEADDLGCAVHKLPCGATVIDMGLAAPGSYEAALMFAAADLGGLAVVQLGSFQLNQDYSFASVEVYSDFPMISCICSQIAGWRLGRGEFAAIGSGPARALASKPDDLYASMMRYHDRWHEAVLCIQGLSLPSEELALTVARDCWVEPQNLYLLVTSNNSITGSLQVSARILEQVCHKMFEKGFDAGKAVRARGSAPIAPITRDEGKTMGRINDAILYGGDTEFWVDAADEEIAAVIEKLTSRGSSPCYGELFEKVFDRAGRNFFNIDHDVHSIARVQIHNIATGKSFRAVEINRQALERSFLR